MPPDWSRQTRIGHVFREPPTPRFLAQSRLVGTNRRKLASDHFLFTDQPGTTPFADTSAFPRTDPVKLPRSRLSGVGRSVRLVQTIGKPRDDQSGHARHRPDDFNA